MHPLETRVLLPKDLRKLNNIQEYKTEGGLSGLQKAREMDPFDVIALCKEANVRGRGGAGFPAAIKWDTVAKAPDEKKYIVCNFAEGEPGTNKDRFLVERNPYMVLEGMLIVAHAIGAKQAIIGTKEKFKHIVPRLQDAMKEFVSEGICDEGYLRLVLGPDSYLFGEEKALLEVIDGRTPMPRFFPPYLVGVGVGPNETNPTVVNNVETLSHLPHILSKGADWFKERGTEDTPGTGILTLTGDVKKPGIYEVSLGLTVREFLYDLGGGPLDGKEFKAVFSGVSNKVMTPDQFDLKMDFGTLRAAGVGLGSGGFMVYDSSRSMVQVAHMFSRFLAYSSCGQCIPCNKGTRVITEFLERIMNNDGDPEELLAEIYAEKAICTEQTRCFLPKQESIVIPSIIEKFRTEFVSYQQEKDQYDHDIKILKVQYFDADKNEFTFEADPIEFREPLAY